MKNLRTYLLRWLPLALLPPATSGCYRGSGDPSAEDGAEAGSDDADDDGATDGDDADDDSTADGSDDGGWTADCDPDTTYSGIRMLNRREYQNTLRDLVGLTAAEVETITANVPADATIGFDTNAASLASSDVLVEQQLDVAEAISTTADLGALVPCDVAAPGDPDACLDAFIADFGRLAFRRPVQGDERSALLAVYATAESDGLAFDERMRLVLQTLLQSPQFLYRIEASASDEGGIVAVEPYALASRLSYFLWASMPDVELLDAAEAGALDGTAGVETQVRRMLEDDRAQAMTAEFHRQWLQLSRLDETAAPAHVEDFDALKGDFFDEAIAFTQHVLWDGQGTARGLMLADTVFVNDRLAELYWIDGSYGAELQAIDATDKRFGLLTLGSFLTQTSNSDRTSPTRRGDFVQTQLLCAPPPDIPDDVEMLDPVPGGEATTARDRVEQHLTDPACKACHLSIDPIGFGLEKYDNVGEFRLAENSIPIDASGSLVFGTEEIEFDGAHELATVLADTPQFERCVARQWFRFALGRMPDVHDACQLDELVARMDATEGDLTELIVDVATSYAMRHIATEAQ